jgi:hypothetical protein
MTKNLGFRIFQCQTKMCRGIGFCTYAPLALDARKSRCIAEWDSPATHHWRWTLDRAGLFSCSPKPHLYRNHLTNHPPVHLYILCSPILLQYPVLVISSTRLKQTNAVSKTKTLLVDLIARFSPNVVFSKDQVISQFFSQFLPTLQCPACPFDYPSRGVPNFSFFLKKKILHCF